MEVKSNRERYTDRLKAKYPDKEFADDEALFAQINDEYDGLDKELSGYKELCAKVIAQPAPKFYLTPGSAKVMVCKARKQWIQEKWKRLRLL